MLLWELATGAVPYEGLSGSAVIFGVGSQSLTLPVPETAPPGFRLLLNLCWQSNPHHRPAFRQIIIHLDILSNDDSFGDISAAAQLHWRQEITSRFETLQEQDDDNESDNDDGPDHRRELSHIERIRLQVEQEREQYSRKRAELELVELKLRMREEELAKREKKSHHAISPKTKVIKDNLRERANMMERFFETKRRVSETSATEDSGLEAKQALFETDFPTSAHPTHSRNPSDLPATDFAMLAVPFDATPRPSPGSSIDKLPTQELFSFDG